MRRRGHTPRLNFLPLSPLPGWPLHAASTLHCKVAADASFMSDGRDQLPQVVVKCFEIHLGLDFMKMFKLMSVASRLAHDRWRHWNWVWGRTSQDPTTPLRKSGDGRRGERYPLMLTDLADVTALSCSSSKWRYLKLRDSIVWSFKENFWSFVVPWWRCKQTQCLNWLMSFYAHRKYSFPIHASCKFLLKIV